uniref:Uncharacterized protein n=1 Tax=Pseudomonas phage RVTF4 TaxID=3236931 RepID=A0AB39CCS3_9VIRU
MAATPSTPTGLKPGQQKKTYAELVGVDVSATGFGFADDLAAIAQSRKAPQQPTTAATNPKA